MGKILNLHSEKGKKLMYEGTLTANENTSPTLKNSDHLWKISL